MAFPFLFRPALLLPPPGFAKLRLYPCSSRQSVSTPYYIYKFSECRAAAIALESDFIPKMPKKGHSIDNLLKGFSLYDEICSELAKDKELVQILRSVITDSCYPDLALKTLTIVKKELRKVAHKHLFNYYKKLDKNYLTLDDLNSLPQGYAVTAKDVAALSGQNIVKGIHPIKAFMQTVGLMNMRQF